MNIFSTGPLDTSSTIPFAGMVSVSVFAPVNLITSCSSYNEPIVEPSNSNAELSSKRRSPTSFSNPNVVDDCPSKTLDIIPFNVPSYFVTPSLSMNVTFLLCSNIPSCDLLILTEYSLLFIFLINTCSTTASADITLTSVELYCTILSVAFGTPENSPESIWTKTLLSSS